MTDAGALKFARITTFTFVTVSMLIAIATNGEGVVLKIVVDLVSWAVGLIVWAVVKWGLDSTDTTLVVALPLATSLVVYVGLGWLLPERRPEVDELIESLNSDPDELTAHRAAAVN